MVIQGRVKSTIPQTWKRAVRKCRVSLDVKHLHGPKDVRLADDEAAVTCVLKNGAFYLESFLKHYACLGFRHILLLDNGSTDETLGIARRNSNVSIFQSGLPIEAHQADFKRYLARHVVGGWCLDADIDEFFDYPWSESMPLHELLRYLTHYNYTAVVTHLLDVFATPSVGNVKEMSDADLAMKYCYYDLTDITTMEYCDAPMVNRFGNGNIPALGAARLHWGASGKLCGGIIAC